MTKSSPRNPLPPCPATPNCIRTSEAFDKGIEKVFEAVTQVIEDEAHSFEVVNPRRIEIHAVYRIPVFGFKDDVDIILEDAGKETVLFIRSASRLGTYDLGVNKRRIKRVLRKIGNCLKKR